MTDLNPTTEPKKSTKAAIGSVVLDFVKMAGLAIITIVAIRYFLFKPFYVKGASMEPTFFDREYLIIDELSYRLHAPDRGDIIVFHYPNDPSQYFLKRVIGLPGERVKVENGKVTIYNDKHPEGVAIDETYLPSDLETMGDETTTLGSDEYFVLGDNRPNSFDSRRFGPVNKSLIVGKVIFRGWPLNRLQEFKTPSLNI